MDKPKSTEWPSEDRIEAIGQNGPSGDHYEDDAFRECERRINDRNLAADLRAANRVRQEQIEALSADLVKVRNEKDALAAHVDHLRKAALDAIPNLPGGDIKANLRDAYDETPETSLAKRDAEQQKVGAASFRYEIMESVQAPFRPHIQGVFEVWLRRQAGGDI